MAMAMATATTTPPLTVEERAELAAGPPFNTINARRLCLAWNA